MEVRDVDRLVVVERKVDELEKNYSVLKEDIMKVRGDLTLVQNGQLQLENTVLKGNQDQKELLNKLLDHSLDLKKTKMVARKEIILAVLSGGSIVGLVAGAVLNWL